MAKSCHALVAHTYLCLGLTALPGAHPSAPTFTYFSSAVVPYLVVEEVAGCSVWQPTAKRLGLDASSPLSQAPKQEWATMGVLLPTS